MKLTNASLQAHPFFAVPCYGGQLTEAFFSSFLKLQIALHQAGMKYSLQTIVNESLITRARNTLVAHFLANPHATHLMFIDSDIRFEPESFFRLLEDEKDVVGGAYPKKTIDWASVKSKASSLSVGDLPIAGSEYAMNLLPAQGAEAIEPVRDLGTGFLLIRRDVILKMMKHYQDLRYRNTMIQDERYRDLFFSLFDTSIDEEGIYLSEDYTFCRRWQKLGGKIYLDRRLKLDHIGTYAFHGRPLEA